jgi:thiol-disulfide isomerase/thioredoxin
MAVRLVVVAAVVLLLAAAPALYRRRQQRLQRGPATTPPVPADLLGGAERTWVVFTTPWCATCGPVEQQLRASDPGARVVKVDATREPNLAGAFSVRTAPTVLLADVHGRVTTRLVGPEAVNQYVTARS